MAPRLEDGGEGKPWAWADCLGSHEQRFEAVVTDAEPKVNRAVFIVSYNFTLGKPL